MLEQVVHAQSTSALSASPGIAAPARQSLAVGNLRGHGSLDNLLEAFFFVNSLEASARHAARNFRDVLSFLRESRIVAVSEITTHAIQAYMVQLAGRGLKPKTLANRLSTISRFCTLLVERDQLEYNPCRRVRLPRKEIPPPRFLNSVEVAKALALAQQHGIYCEVCLAVNTGLRMTELRLLEWRDIDFDRRALLVRRSKSRRHRTVWLNQRALAALKEQYARSGMYVYVFPGGRRRKDGRPGKGPWNPNQPRGERWWLEALKPLQAAIPTFQSIDKGSVGRGWHLLRHTFASRLVQAGVPIYKVSAWMGHSDVKTTMIYAHLSPDFDEDIEKV